MAAVATITTTFPVTDNTSSTQIVRGTIALTDDYVAGGDTLALNLFGVQSNQLPLDVKIFEKPVAGETPSGYILQYAWGTTQANGAIQVLETAASPDPAAAGPLVEIEAGAYPAALTGAVIAFEATFPHGM